MSTNNNAEAYREKIYESYWSQVRHKGNKPTSKEYLHWGNAAKVRLEEWLPTDFNTPIFDIGCGVGQFLYLLEQLNYSNVTGVDLSPEQVKIAREWCSRATIIQGNARDVLAERKTAFGLITGFDVIEHLNKTEAMDLLALIAESLRPGGRVILQTPNAASPMAGNILYGDFTHEWFYTPTSLGNMLRLHGLTDYSVRPSGPYSHGIKSRTRVFLWKLIQVIWKFHNIIETGSPGSRIYSQVFLASAIKPYCAQ